MANLANLNKRTDAFIIKENHIAVYKESISIDIKRIINKYYKENKYNSKELLSFYSKRGYYPIWADYYLGNQELNDMIKLFDSSIYWGVSNKIFDTDNMHTLFKNKKYAELDIDLSSKYMEYKILLDYGLINPYKSKFIYTDNTLTFKREKLNYLNNLNYSRLNSSCSNIELKQLSNYLKKRIDYYKKSNDLKKSVVSNTNLSNYIYISETNSLDSLTYFAFQKLEKDGLLEKILANFEFYKWNNYNSNCHKRNRIVINIPEKLMRISINNYNFKQKICVGKASEPDSSYTTLTPILNSKLYAITLNPLWRIPLSIFDKEMVAEIELDSNYLKKQKIKLFHYNHEEQDYYTYKNSKRKFDFYAIQNTEKIRTLGKYKFHIQNKRNIFLHGTNIKKIFSKENRSITHGCIRLENEWELAELIYRNLLDKKDKVAHDSIMRSQKWVESKHLLNSFIPVKIQYNTISFSNNEIKFLRDIYKYEKKVYKKVISSTRNIN